MKDSLDPLSDRACRMTDTHTGIEITQQLQVDNSLPSSIAESTIRTKYLDDSYPEWHPAPDSFLGMVRLLIYREITGESYRALARYQELAEPFELDHIPDESVLSRTWRNRFDDDVREFVRSASHFVVKEVHDRELSAPAVRPKSDVDEEIVLPRTTRQLVKNSLTNKSTEPRASHGTTASTSSIRVAPRMLRMRTRNSSSYKRSWG